MPKRNADVLEYRRQLAIKMILEGKKKTRVADDFGVSRAAVTQWWKEYLKGGAQALEKKKRPGRPCELTKEQLAKVPSILAKGAMAYGFPNALWTTKRIAAIIKFKFGIDYHRNHVDKLLQKLEWTWQKPKKRATQRDEERIGTWVSKEWLSIKKKPLT